MMYTSQFWKTDPYDWFCAPGSHIVSLFSLVISCSLTLLMSLEEVEYDTLSQKCMTYDADLFICVLLPSSGNHLYVQLACWDLTSHQLLKLKLDLIKVCGVFAVFEDYIIISVVPENAPNITQCLYHQLYLLCCCLLIFVKDVCWVLWCLHVLYTVKSTLHLILQCRTSYFQLNAKTICVYDYDNMLKLYNNIYQFAISSSISDNLQLK